MLDGRHEHQVAARQRDVRGDARALGAERLLEHLDHDLLALVQPLLDRRAAHAPPPLLLGGEQVLGQLLEHVGDVEERVALEPEVDERRLHAGQHARDPALVDVADDAALRLALDEDLGRRTLVLEEGDPGLAADCC